MSDYIPTSTMSMIPATVEHRRKASWFVPGREYDYKLVTAPVYVEEAQVVEVKDDSNTEE